MPDESNLDEWKLLLESVMMAGIAVTAAELSGLWGLLKESVASGNALTPVGSNIPCLRIQRRRSRATSARFCSAAYKVFFEADVASIKNRQTGAWDAAKAISVPLRQERSSLDHLVGAGEQRSTVLCQKAQDWRQSAQQTVTP
jgi:hypothetical protein